VWREGAGALCASASGSDLRMRDTSESELKAGAIDSSSSSNSSKEFKELKQVCGSQQSAITTAVRCVRHTDARYSCTSVHALR
jgi:hypothetical protein